MVRSPRRGGIADVRNLDQPSPITLLASSANIFVSYPTKTYLAALRQRHAAEKRP
jgi:hypothetical protein